jgi:transposase-like protein
MKGEEFQTLVGQLGALSEGQRAALLKALSSAKKPDEVIRLIETQFDASPRCGHCGSALFKRWGVDAGLKRYKCKGCNKTFNALTGTPLATLKHRDRWLAYAKALVDGVSLRKAAQRARIDLTTAFRWRHRFLQVPKTGLPLITIPGSKLESGRVQPAFGLAGAERRADQALAARSLLGPAADIAARNAA